MIPIMLRSRTQGGIAPFHKVENMMKKKGLSVFLLVAAGVAALGSAASAQGVRLPWSTDTKAKPEPATPSGQDIPAGWSVDTQPKRAVLTYAPEPNGPRYLIVACLRDSEEIGIYSTGIAVPSGKPVVSLGMSNAGRKYTVRGDIGMDNKTNQPAFRYETNIDSKALSIFRSDFLPMLNGKGPLTVKIGEKEQQLPLAGVSEPLKKFSATCFGKS
jgi:hypothetical protein